MPQSPGQALKPPHLLHFLQVGQAHFFLQHLCGEHALRRPLRLAGHSSPRIPGPHKGKVGPASQARAGRKEKGKGHTLGPEAASLCWQCPFSLPSHTDLCSRGAHPAESRRPAGVACLPGRLPARVHTRGSSRVAGTHALPRKSPLCPATQGPNVPCVLPWALLDACRRLSQVVCHPLTGGVPSTEQCGSGTPHPAGACARRAAAQRWQARRGRPPAGPEGDNAGPQELRRFAVTQAKDEPLPFGHRMCRTKAQGEHKACRAR